MSGIHAGPELIRQGPLPHHAGPFVSGMPAGLELVNLGVSFRDDEMRRLAAVQGVSFTLQPGSITCLVGESGCGKSLTARACMGLVPRTGELSGKVLFKGEDLLQRSEKAWQSLRGRTISMIFQEPMTALNPVLRVGMQAAEPLRYHKGLSKQEARDTIIELFAQVGIPSAAERYELYPHELSGGMRQRVMIAMALSCEPEILLADEPTTALDATIQGQILAILADQCEKRGMAVLLITHDLGVVARTAEQVGVMYAGHLVEWGSVQDVLQQPAHPYTRGLMACDPARVAGTARRLPVIAGTVPALGAMPDGCPFHPRCPEADAGCAREKPVLRELSGGHRVCCHKA